MEPGSSEWYSVREQEAQSKIQEDLSERQEAFLL